MIQVRKAPDARQTELTAIDGPKVYRTRDSEQNIILYMVYRTTDGAITQEHMSVPEARALRDRLNDLLSARDIAQGAPELRYRDMPHGKYGHSEIEEAGEALMTHLNWVELWRENFDDALGKHELPKRVMAELDRLKTFVGRSWQGRRAFMNAQERLRAWERGDSEAQAKVPTY